MPFDIWASLKVGVWFLREAYASILTSGLDRGYRKINESIEQKLAEKFSELKEKMSEAINHIQRNCKVPRVRLEESFRKFDSSNTDLFRRLALEDENKNGQQLYNLPATSTYFYGRTTELRNMSEKLEAANPDIEPSTYALHGIGGVGKSSLAGHCAKQSL